MAVEHLQRHLPEIDKSLVAQKSGKTSFPNMGIIKAKVKEYILENTPPEPVVEKPKLEERKSVTNEKEKPSPKQEKTEENLKTPKKAEPAVEVEDKTPKKEEDQKGEELNKPGLESNKSSVSCQSTTENEGSSNKETSTEQKSSELALKSDNTEDEAKDGKKQSKGVSSEEDNNKENIDFSQYVFRSLNKDNKEENGNCAIFIVFTQQWIDKRVESLNQTPYHNDFDKKIVENVFGNLSNNKTFFPALPLPLLESRQNSRFKFAQENSQEDFDEIKREEEQRASDVDLEFNNISRSIQDYMDLAISSMNPPTTNNPSNKRNGIFSFEKSSSIRYFTDSEDPNTNEADLKNAKAHYGLFNNGYENAGTAGEYKDDAVNGDIDKGDLSAGEDKKGSGSKNKRGKNKRKNKSNSKNKNDINGDLQV